MSWRHDFVQHVPWYVKFHICITAPVTALKMVYLIFSTRVKNWAGSLRKFLSIFCVRQRAPCLVSDTTFLPSLIGCECFMHLVNTLRNNLVSREIYQRIWIVAKLSDMLKCRLTLWYDVNTGDMLIYVIFIQRIVLVVLVVFMVHVSDSCTIMITHQPYCIYGSLIWVIIALGNGLLCIRRSTIKWFMI